MTDLPAPHRSTLMEVKPDWIDYNGHLNMAYYNVLMDLGADQAFDLMGFGPDYASERKLTTYSAEYHMRYIREIHQGDKVYVTTQLIDFTEKSFHFCQELFHEDGWLSARGEGLGLHVDMTGPKVAAMPEDTLASVRALHAAHAQLPRPEWVGQPIGLRRKG